MAAWSQGLWMWGDTPSALWGIVVAGSHPSFPSHNAPHPPPPHPPPPHPTPPRTYQDVIKVALCPPLLQHPPCGAWPHLGNPLGHCLVVLSPRGSTPAPLPPPQTRYCPPPRRAIAPPPPYTHTHSSVPPPPETRYCTPPPRPKRTAPIDGLPQLNSMPACVCTFTVNHQVLLLLLLSACPFAPPALASFTGRPCSRPAPYASPTMHTSPTTAAAAAAAAAVATTAAAAAVAATAPQGAPKGRPAAAAAAVVVLDP